MICIDDGGVRTHVCPVCKGSVVDLGRHLIWHDMNGHKVALKDWERVMCIEHHKSREYLYASKMVANQQLAIATKTTESERRKKAHLKHKFKKTIVMREKQDVPNSSRTGTRAGNSR